MQMQFTANFGLDKAIVLCKKTMLYIVLDNKEYEAYYYFCNNLKMNVHWNHTAVSELACPWVSNAVNLNSFLFKFAETFAVFFYKRQQKTCYGG